MINGLGVVGWGVGGIEAEAGMLGQPVYFLTPEVVGRAHERAIARRRHRDRSCLAHHAIASRSKSGRQICRVLRRRRRVAAGSRSRDHWEHVAGVRRDDGIFPDRSRIGRLTCARPDAAKNNALRSKIIFVRRKCSACRRRAKSITASISIWISRTCSRVSPDRNGRRTGSICRILERTFRALLEKPVRDGGYGKQNVDLREKHLVELNGSAPRNGEMASTDKKEDQGISPGDERNKIEMISNRPTPDPGKEIEAESSDVFTHGRTHVGHGSVLIAAITSCTNTSNPSVMIAAGLLAKKAVERGLRVDPGGENIAGAGLAGCFRLSPQDRTAEIPRPARIQPRRLRLHHLHRQLGAAASEHREGDQQIRSGCRLGSFGKPQLRSARASKYQGEFPDVAAAGGRVRARRPGAH